VERSDFSPQFAVFKSDSLVSAAKITDKLRHADCVAAVWSISDYLPETLWGQTIPDAIKKRYSNFMSNDGKYAVYAFPVGNIWEDGRNRYFTDTMRKINENVSGMPFISSFMISETKSAARQATALSSIILMIIVWINFRNLRCTILTVVPTFMSLIWMNGIMRLLGMSYNPINLMALPIIIGIAVDNGVYIVNRFLIEHGNLNRTLSSTGRSVLLTSFTTIAAFGTLALTTHRGLRSFSLTLTIGIASAMILSLTVLPFLLGIFRRSIVLAYPIPDSD
jgi:predicted RND superfamily exporter protein